MKEQEIDFIENALSEARQFSKDVRQYLYEIEKQRPLTEIEKKLWDKTHDVHIHTNDAGIMMTMSAISHITREMKKEIPSSKDKKQSEEFVLD